jgi:hypothetical protein
MARNGDRLSRPTGAVALGAVLMLLAGCNESDRIGEWRKAAIREACFGATARPERNTPHLPTRDHRISLPTIVRGTEMMTALHCYIVTNTQAVCDRHNRAYIVDYIGRYFRFMDGMYRVAADYGEREKRNVDAFWTAHYPRAIKIALEDHVRNGRLNYNDFGWSRPAQLTGLLTKYKGTNDVCPNARVAGR